MNRTAHFPGRVGVQQRVLPDYRAPFFDHLAGFCEGGLSVFAGRPRPNESIQPMESMTVAQHTSAKNRHLFRDQFYLCFQPGLVRWLRDWDPNVLIMEANPRYPSNRRAIRWMKRRGRPVIGWGLGAPPLHGMFSKIRRWSRRRYLLSFDALVAYSTAGAEQYALLGIDSDRIHVAINSAILPPSRFPERTRSIGHVARVLFVGRVQERKRIDLLIKACALVEPSPELWIVGDGPELDILKQVAHIIFPTTKFFGALRGYKLEELFDLVDLFVLPGTGGLAVQEAMAHGLPVIVAEGDGTQRDLVRPENGWLVKPGDLEDLVRTLREAISKPKRLPQMGVASYRVVVDRANIDAMAKVFVEVMNTLYTRDR
jgi:glycosyltransferase involved in cell wall biosynthesis